MLYNPLSEIQYVLTVSRFKQWLDTQPQEGRYNYGECWNCALAQYLKACGFTEVVVHARGISVNHKWLLLPKDLNAIVEHGDHSYGAASKRAELALV